MTKKREVLGTIAIIEMFMICVLIVLAAMILGSQENVIDELRESLSSARLVASKCVNSSPGEPLVAECDLRDAFVQRRDEDFVTYNGERCYSIGALEQSRYLVRLSRRDEYDERALTEFESGEVKIVQCGEWTDAMERRMIVSNANYSAKRFSTDWSNFCRVATKKEIAEVCKKIGHAGACTICSDLTNAESGRD